MHTHITQSERPLLVRIKQHVRAFALAAAVIVSAAHAHAQGCIAIKQMGDDSCSLDGLMAPTTEKWDLNVSYEHFRSHRHFSQTNQNFSRYYLGSEVINNVDQLDAAVNYQLNARTSFTLDLPYFSATRSSLYEHDGKNRYTTSAAGIGDVRLVAQRWLFDPHSDAKTNVAIGLGLKMPTGDANAQDVFHTKTGDVTHAVDQSIQPGDGAWGYTFQLQAYRRLFARTSLYATGFYLVNPKETNDTRTTSAITSFTAYNSVADQYQARLGVSHVFLPKYNFTASLGARLEGVPALDLIGGDRGFRRPGYVVSVEPGFSVAGKHDSFSFSLPVVLVRNRIRSASDRLGKGAGDAAFADFLISMSYAHKW